MDFTQVTITADNIANSYENATKHAVALDNKKHATDFVTINWDSRIVHLTQLGIGTDRYYSY